MPPTQTDEGIRAAREIREQHPGDGGARALAARRAHLRRRAARATAREGLGYLLKDRVTDVDEFAAAVRRVAEGGSALDPLVVAELVGRNRADDPLVRLSPREREVLELMAEGRTNHAIGAAALHLAARGREARDGDLHEARPARRARGPPARARGADVPALVAAPQRCGKPHHTTAGGP